MRTLLLPGWAGTASCFAAFRDRLPGEVTCASWADHVAAPEALLDGVEGPVLLVAWSLGGQLALAAAAARPEKVAGLVLFSTSARFLAAKEHPGASPRALARMRRKLATDAGAVLEDFSLNCFSPAADHPGRPRWREEAASFPVGVLDAGLEFLGRVDLRGALPPPSVPALVLHGREDQVVPADGGIALAKALGVECRLFDGAGHALPIVDADGVRPHLERFLNDRPSV